jgi:hypothetical protein
MPESGLPIRVYEEHDMWHVDYGEGETEDHTSREKARQSATTAHFDTSGTNYCLPLPALRGARWVGASASSGDLNDARSLGR